MHKTQNRFVYLYWIKKINTEAQSKFWNKYIQIVSTINGLPKIVCKSCQKILNYSTIYNYSNISNIKKYL